VLVSGQLPPLSVGAVETVHGAGKAASWQKISI
jgi:hypothetical protein